jgi:hypothetical protein
MTRFSRALLAAGVVAAALLAGMAPAQAAPPFPPGAQATALVGGTPLVQAICPAGSPGAVRGGISTRGGVSVGYPAGARCTPQAAASDGLYAIAGETPPLPGTLRFTADCVNSTGQNGGAVDVPAGTNVAGIGVVTRQTTITTPNTMVTYPNGTTAILNEVIIDEFSVTRNAIRITSGPNSGTIVGQVICGIRYPLAVDNPSGAEETAAVATPDSPISDSGTSRTALLVGAAVGLLLLAQLPIALLIRRRRGASAA